MSRALPVCRTHHLTCTNDAHLVDDVEGQGSNCTRSHGSRGRIGPRSSDATATAPTPSLDGVYSAGSGRGRKRLSSLQKQLGRSRTHLLAVSALAPGVQLPTPLLLTLDESDA